jgi:hypothetical protein
VISEVEEHRHANTSARAIINIPQRFDCGLQQVGGFVKMKVK